MRPQRKIVTNPVERRRRRIAIFGLAATILLLAVGAVAVGSPIIRWISDPSQFRVWALSHGFLAKLAMTGICAIQVILAFIPGEPIQIAAGMAFGAGWGVVVTIVGIAAGQLVVFALTKRYGLRFVELFFDRDSIYSLPFFKDHKRLDALLFLLFFIPGAPKDLFTYASALTPIGMWRFLLLSMIARAPAIVASSWGGSAIGSSRMTMAIWILGITALVGLAGIIFYRWFQKRRSQLAGARLPQDNANITDSSRINGDP